MKRFAQLLRVRDEGGRPCAGATIAVKEAQGPVPELGYVTAENGDVQIGLPPGKVTLEALLPSGERYTFAIDAAAGRTEMHDVRLGVRET